jgi:hypothetical protein
MPWYIHIWQICWIALAIWILNTLGVHALLAFLAFVALAAIITNT